MSLSTTLTGHIWDNLSVQVTFARYNTSYESWVSKEQTPAFHRLYLIVDGEGSIKVNGKTYYPQPNQLVILPAGTEQSRTHSKEHPYSRYICHFNAQVGAWPLFHDQSLPCFSNVDQPEQIRDIFDQLIYQYQRKTAFSSLYAQAALLQLLAYCFEEGRHTHVIHRFMKSSEGEKLAQVLAYIDSRITEPLEVDELAELVHLHPNYFIPYFKKHMGITPIHYVQKKRIEEAKKLLSYTDNSISEIANQIGMELSHFSKQFKQFTGLSPSSYRSCTR
jgi:AraC-like DNA-binding protein/mannose-6-phosphate isomerase-like protein (cupin superfamily)